MSDFLNVSFLFLALVMNFTRCANYVTHAHPLSSQVIALPLCSLSWLFVNRFADLIDDLIDAHIDWEASTLDVNAFFFSYLSELANLLVSLELLLDVIFQAMLGEMFFCEVEFKFLNSQSKRFTLKLMFIKPFLGKDPRCHHVILHAANIFLKDQISKKVFVVC